MEYHTFKKPVKGRDGRQVHRWYYYYIDQNGKQIQKSCGKKVKNRSDAENFIRNLPDYGSSQPGAKVLIRTIAENMYIPGSYHYRRRAELGRSTDINTMKESRGLIVKIIEDFGDIYIEDLTVVMVTKQLLEKKWSGSRKNRYIQVLGEIYQEAAWHESKVIRPKFPTFARNVRKADIFTTDELNRLFTPENFPSETLFLLFLCCLSAGLRISEARGICRKQIIFDRKILIVDGYCKQDGTRTRFNKKGTLEDPKFRIVFLSDYTLGKLKDYIDRQEDMRDDDFVFTREPGKPIRTEYAEAVFDRALIQAGLAVDLKKPDQENPLPVIYKENDYKKRDIYVPDGRKLVPHSLRYTYVSRMRRELTAAELQPMTGHTSVEMVDYYNRKVLDMAIASLPQKGRAASDTLFV
jgi:integrase